MARSTYIYIAYAEDTLLVAGTVKREVMSFLKRYFPTTEVEIRRYRDGRGSACAVLKNEERN